MLREILNDLSEEKAQVNNKCNKLRAKYEDLLSCQKKMAIDAFTRNHDKSLKCRSKLGGTLCGKIGQ